MRPMKRCQRVLGRCFHAIRRLCRVTTLSSPQIRRTHLPVRPRYWGQGLALRMAWTAITHAFLSSQIDSVIAGTNLPNTASLAVMRRLGMRFHKDVRYPLGAGVECVIHQDDVGPLPKPVLISLG